jgi:site-specific DNA-methyltransferase (adenine-specific)
MAKLVLKSQHRCMCGDSTMIDDVEKLMNGEKADMVFTDPPYRVISGGNKHGREIWNNTSLAKNDGKIFEKNDLKIEDVLPLIHSFTVENCHIYIMVNFLNLSDYLNKVGEVFDMHSLLIWEKGHGLPNKWYCKNIEYTIFARKGEAFNINNMGSMTCHKVAHDKDKVHPTQKPVSLVSFYIENSSRNSQLVFEPFLGSGSTLIACEKTNRKCYGMELDPKYVDVVIKRFEQYSGKKATLELTGQTYEELKAERDLTQPQKQN